MQTLRIPYTTDEGGRELIASLRRVQSAAVRSAYANAGDKDEMSLRHLIKARFGTAILDSWALHCATRIGRTKRKLVPDGSMVFGSTKHLQRRQAGLIDKDQWKAIRLLPFTSYGDRQKARGNQNVHLVDDRALVLKIARRSNGRYGPLKLDTVELRLARMTGNAGEIMRQLAAICAEPEEKNRINVSYAIDERFVSITFDPEDMPDHPERRRPVAALPGRSVGVDLNPGWIGIAAVENVTEPDRLEETALLEHLLVELDLPADASAEQMCEILAATAARAIALARKHRAGVIVLEKGLGKLRSSGKNRSLNRLLNYWARSVFLHMLTRKARLAGIKVMEVWGGYSTTIGNLAFEAPDACASAAEIGRRGIAREAGMKDVLPVLTDEVVAGLWKDRQLPKAGAETLPRRPSTWGELHRGMKTAKLGVRRPHPEIHGDRRGHAVHRLGCKHRPGRIYRLPVPATEAMG